MGRAHCDARDTIPSGVDAVLRVQQIDGTGGAEDEDEVIEPEQRGELSLVSLHATIDL